MAAFLDLCRFVPTAGGTTDWTYSSVVGGCQSPSQAGAVNGLNYKVYAVSSDLTQWEVSQGAYNLSTGTFPRTTVLYNSSGTGTAQGGAGTKINFGAVPNVAIVGLAEDLLSFDTANGFTAAQQNQAQRNLALAAILRNYIAGLQMSAAGSSATFSVSAGVGTDHANTDIMALAAAMSKTTAAWAAGSGSGSLDTGTIAASTKYWAFLIKNPTSGAVDVLTTKSVAATTPAPTLPSGYTLYRYIGSLITDASSNWLAFAQVDDSFFLGASVHDYSNSSATNNIDITVTLTCPLGVRVQPLIRLATQVNTNSNSANIAARSPDLMAAESQPSVDGGTVAAVDAGITANGSSVTRAGGGQMHIYTNTSGQIVVRPYNTAGTTTATVDVRTYGWVDTRGKNA
jgi:hypothetical protein